MQSSDVEILLVEDNPADAELAMHALRKRNLVNQLLWLKDGEEAMNYLFAEGPYAGRNIENHPKVMLLDLKLPKVGGIEILERIRAHESTRAMPVVVLTSSREDPDIKRCYALHCNSYVVKPVDFEKFSDAVAQLGLYWMVINQPPS